MSDILIEDTVVARATPSGTGGVALVRLSGPEAFKIGLKLTDIKEIKPRVAVLTTICDSDGAKIDEGLAVFFPAPYSYTGDDVVELNIHGSDIIAMQVVDSCLTYGARMARPGEFTERAFHAGKMDLIQAGAVCDLIHARSKEAARAALQSLQGRFSDQVKQLQDQLMTMRMYVESSIDFSEEEVDLLSDKAFLGHLHQLKQSLVRIFQQAQSGHLLNQGLRLAIIGPTNAGKSSLMNWLTQMDTSIVTSIAGTTRDVIKEQVVLEGIPVTLIDTAGLRQSDDIVEQHGIARVQNEVMQADRIWLVLPADQYTPDDAKRFWLENFPKVDWPEDQITVVMNKVDLVQSNYGDDTVSLSVLNNQGKESLLSTLTDGISFQEGAISVRQSQLHALKLVKQHIESAYQPIEDHQLDIAAEELSLAQQALSELTGEVTQEDVLSTIFSEFCIGK